MSRFQTATPRRGLMPSHSPPDVQFAPGLELAKRLGWFSIALGAAELLAPQTMSRATGIRNHNLLMAYGVREIVCGIGILMTARPAGWMWARVAGDAMDLATLGNTYMSSDCEDAQAALASAAAVAGVTALDVLAAVELTAAAALEG